MLDLFASSNLYVKIYPDEMEVTYLKDNLTIRRQASQKFSSDRMLIADFHAAEEHLKSIIKELPTRWRSHTMLIQHMVDLGGGLYEVEKRALRDISDHVGAKRVFIVPHTDELSTEEAVHKLAMGLKGGAFMPPDLVT
ncbi:rod shape-determining protein [Hymenobacter psychrophilus]|uniref:Rod shape-determining protein MreB n=1 Tax=Hymenobacter psychrophilus TaxID=651662 RepID=A0A1H3HN67_9BACT|nr:rod shape-determining protein [Hymenobacter psychrophilus]SDY16830.1 hypothetical protein SAMN04488069_10668 [Hymenobacter psychrophilus]